jgi:putative phosphoesterase
MWAGNSIGSWPRPTYNQRVARSSIGLISDTHGLLRPEAIEALRGCDRILHAGDVGSPAILDRLRTLAPVSAVRGNVDLGGWAEPLPTLEVVEVGDVLLCLLHDRESLDLDPAAAGISAVISGHSHRPEVHRSNGILYVNPGSAGPRRFDLPVSVGRLVVNGGSLEAEIVKLDVAMRA